MIRYPFDSILINGRNASIQSILSASAIPQSDFEKNTFSFIADWFKGVENFTQDTSGSTGSPKEISISRAQMIASAKMTEEALDLREGCNALLCLSPQYIAGKMMLVRSFVTGMRVVAVAPSANPLMNLQSDVIIDFAALVPYQIQEIIRSEKSEYLNSIRTIIIGGAALDDETLEKLQAFSCKCYATYGMTETVSHIALKRLNGSGASDLYKILPGISIESDDRGCLVINWSQLPDSIITNDLVHINDKQTFTWLGRWDNIINTGGIKVIPEMVEIEIEKIFKQLKLSQRFFVGGTPDQKLGNKVVLFVEGSLSLEMKGKLSAAMSEAIPKHETPKVVNADMRFIITENGKINRKATANLT